MATITGTSGNESLTGTSGNDTISGLGNGGGAAQLIATITNLQAVTATDIVVV
jgi:Ca2+-binding RTX toxin-like protein